MPSARLLKQKSAISFSVVRKDLLLHRRHRPAPGRGVVQVSQQMQEAMHTVPAQFFLHRQGTGGRFPRRSLETDHNFAQEERFAFRIFFSIEKARTSVGPLCFR